VHFIQLGGFSSNFAVVSGIFQSERLNLKGKHMLTARKKMAHLARRVLLLLTLIIIAAFPGFSQRETKDDKYWALSEKYCNARFGFCISYPASLQMDRPPENDDGRRFDNGNGLVVTASGINNVSHDTLKSEMRTASDSFDRITYRAKGKNWFVLSGRKKDKIIYLKTFIGRGSVNHLDIEYPVRQKTVYRKVVGNIAGSFRPGQLGVPN
jgi:hypothetical protein